MDDLDIEDWWTGGSFVESGIPINSSNINISDLSGIDFSDAISFGDLSDIVDLGNLNYDYLSNLDYGYGIPEDILNFIPETTYTFEETPFVAGDTPQFDFGYGEDVDYGEKFGDVLKDISPGISGFAEAADEVGGSLSGGVDYGETFGDVVPEYDYIDSSTVVPDERIYDAEAQEGGFYGNTKNATYDPKTNTTTIRNNQGEVVRTVYHTPPGSTGGETGGGKTGSGSGDTKTKTPSDKVSTWSDLLKTLTSKDNAMLLALLGGLMGLLSKGSAPKGPVGYQGSIPKFTAVRGKPGEGTKFVQAAGGGLMDLAQGGRAARYLRGGTDGMADKIKTNIDGKQPARLSHGEFVIPADVVSHLGNGNSDAGADVLYEMMDKIRTARTGTKKQGRQINPRKYIPA